MADSTARTAFWEGARTILPMLLGIVPFGVIVGITAAGTEIGGLTGFLTSPIIFAGAAQLATIQLVDQGAAAAVIVATALVINSRHLMYSAGLAGPFQQFPRSWRFSLPYLLTDQAFLFSSLTWETEDDPVARRWFFLGVGLGLWVPWQIATAGGVLVGTGIPDSWQLDFAIPLVFMALLPTAIRARPELAAAVVAGTVAVIAQPMPWNAGLMVAAASGIGTGVAVARGRP